MYLGDQKLPVEVPRVRDTATCTEVPLEVYKSLQGPQELDEGMLLRVLKGISCRNYEACAQTVPETFGISASSVSRRFVKASAKNSPINIEFLTSSLLVLLGSCKSTISTSLFAQRERDANLAGHIVI